MKKTISQRFFLSLCLMIVGCLWGSAAWATPGDVVYTLKCVYNSKNTTYDTNTYNVTYKGLTWITPGNQGPDQKKKTDFWRIGGKSLNKVDRTITGKDAISKAISKVTLAHKGISNANAKINSVSLTVASDAKFTNIIETVSISSPSVGGAGTIDFAPEKSGIWPKDSYYKLTINITNSSKDKNYGLDITSLTFYEGAEAPAKTLSSVAVSGTPTKTTYEADDAFDPTGLVVTGTYSDGSHAKISKGITWTVTPEKLTAGETSVIVKATVDGVTSAEHTVEGLTVTAARTLSSVTLEGNPTKTTYIVGETFDPTGIKVMANYTTGDPKDVTSEAIFNFDNSALTLSTTSMAVTATYGGMTSAEQNYTITVLKTIVPFAPKVIYRKITSTADIVDGGVYLIVCEARNEAMGSLNSSSNRGEGEPITISGNTYTGKVNQSGCPYEITISQAKNGNYNLYHASGYFINGKNGNDLVFSTTTGDDGWSVIFDEDGNVEISNSKKEGNYIQRYKTSNYYKNYSSSSGGQTPVQLYQKFGEMSIAQVTGGITTYVADFAYSMPQHLVGHTVTQADKAGVITTHKAFRAGEEVPALTPLLIKSTEDYEETSKTYYPAVLNKSVAAYEGDNMLEYNRDAYGLTKTTNSESVYYYKLAIKDGNVGFYWGADEGAAFQMTKPSTAYLTVPQTMSVQGFVLNLEEGETTGIATVTTDENVPIYNLQGIRMNGKNLPKGIYIQGGKKFMVK